VSHKPGGSYAEFIISADLNFGRVSTACMYIQADMRSYPSSSQYWISVLIFKRALPDITGLTLDRHRTDRHQTDALYAFRHERLKFKILAHQSLTSTAPTYLSADIQLVSEHGRRHLRSSSYRTLAVPRRRTTLGDRSFADAGPRVWNSLPAAIRQITSYGEFGQHLKTRLGPLLRARNRSAL